MTSSFKLRVTWAQPEDLVGHFFSQAKYEGVDVSAEIAQWESAGGISQASVVGASVVPATPAMRDLARSISAAVEAKLQANPELDYEKFLSDLPDTPSSIKPDLNTFHGAWLGRAAGCLLGKPVEKVQRVGIRAILESSGRWPLTEYFTAQGVPAEVLVKHPWNTQSGKTC